MALLRGLTYVAGIFLACWTVLVGCSNGNHAGDFSELLVFMQSEMEANGVPGGSIAIVIDGYISNTTGLGVKKHGSNDPVDSYTLFRTGSTGKMLTAAALMTLVDEGKLDMHAPVTDYVPYFQLLPPHDPGSITTHHCLTHTSGLADYGEKLCDTDPDTLSLWFQEKSNTIPLWAPPGRMWNYNNLGYYLAGLVLEEVSGEYFTDAMQHRLFDRCNMVNTTYKSSDVFAYGNYAVGHIFDEEGNIEYIAPDTIECGFVRPAGCQFASTVDMAGFIEMILADGVDVLTSESVGAMTASYVETYRLPDSTYGYGIAAIEYKGINVLLHGGDAPGFMTHLWMVPEANFGVVVVVNSSQYDPMPIAKKALDIYLKLPEMVEPDYSTPKETWGKYTGTYYDPYSLGKIQVTQNAELDLSVQFTDLQYTTELQQFAYDIFEFDFFGLGLFKMNFVLDEIGVPEYVCTRIGVGKRVKGID
jgi:CubicO group peptidase (beta-lactamase class C family)